MFRKKLLLEMVIGHPREGAVRGRFQGQIREIGLPQEKIEVKREGEQTLEGQNRTRKAIAFHGRGLLGGVRTTGK